MGQDQFDKAERFLAIIEGLTITIKQPIFIVKNYSTKGLLGMKTDFSGSHCSNCTIMDNTLKLFVCYFLMNQSFHIKIPSVISLYVHK